METRNYWEENGHAVKYDNYNSSDGFGRVAEQLNFATAPSDDEADYPPGAYLKKGKVSRQDPMSHRIIEKRRRDRMNNCLADLSRLIPPEYLKKGRGRVEKTEIIEMAIRHLKYLQDRVNAAEQLAAEENFRAGYREAAAEAVRFLVEAHEYGAGDGLCSQLASHLQRHCEVVTKGEGRVVTPRQDAVPPGLVLGDDELVRQLARVRTEGGRDRAGPPARAALPRRRLRRARAGTLLPDGLRQSVSRPPGDGGGGLGHGRAAAGRAAPARAHAARRAQARPRGLPALLQVQELDREAVLEIAGHRGRRAGRARRAAQGVQQAAPRRQAAARALHLHLQLRLHRGRQRHLAAGHVERVAAPPQPLREATSAHAVCASVRTQLSRQVLRAAERVGGVRGAGGGRGRVRAGRAGARGGATAPGHHPRQLPALPRLPRQARARRPRLAPALSDPPVARRPRAVRPLVGRLPTDSVWNVYACGWALSGPNGRLT